MTRSYTALCSLVKECLPLFSLPLGIWELHIQGFIVSVWSLISLPWPGARVLGGTRKLGLWG